MGIEGVWGCSRVPGPRCGCGNPRRRRVVSLGTGRPVFPYLARGLHSGLVARLAPEARRKVPSSVRAYP